MEKTLDLIQSTFQTSQMFKELFGTETRNNIFALFRTILYTEMMKQDGSKGEI